MPNQQINKSTFIRSSFSEGGNQQKLCVIIFLIAGIIFIPYTYNSIYDILASSIRLFDLGLISVLACCLILFFYTNLNNLTYSKNSKTIGTNFLFIIVMGFFLIVIIQFFYYKELTLNEFFLSTFWITIPFVSYLYSKEITKYLPIYIYLIWLANLAACYFLPGEKVGIAGNRNWNAALMIACAIFSIYQSYLWLKILREKTKKTAQKPFHPLLLHITSTTLIIIIFCMLLYSAFIFYNCRSRGAVLSGIIVFLIFLYFKLNNYLKASKVKLLTYISCFILLLLIITTILFFNKSINQQISKSTIVSSLKEDVRIPLWIGTIKLIKDYPVIGTNPSAFESIYASYRPLDYFTKPNNSVRSNHPHNTLLYIGAIFGIPGLVLWCILWLYPAIYCLYYSSKLSTFKQLVLYAYIFLFLHGLLDLVLFHWPTVYLAATFLGVLWKETFEDLDPKKSNLEQSTTHHSLCTTKIYQYIIKPLLLVTAIIIAIYMIYGIYINYKSKYYFETGNYYTKQKKDFRALYQYHKGLEYKLVPKYLYKAGVTAITSLDNPELALYFFNFFNYIAQFDYAHKNGFIALSLLKTGNKSATIPYLVKEVVNYPLSAGAWYRLYLIQKQLKMHNAAKFSLENTYRALNAKNLSKKALPLLLENPEYDNHPERIPKDRLKDIQQSSLNTNNIH